MQVPTVQIKSAWPRTTLFLEKKTICITFSAIQCQISLLGSLSWRGLLSYLSGFVYFASLPFHCSHVAKSFSACAQTCICLVISPASILSIMTFCENFKLRHTLSSSLHPLYCFFMALFTLLYTIMYTLIFVFSWNVSSVELTSLLGTQLIFVEWKSAWLLVLRKIFKDGKSLRDYQPDHFTCINKSLSSVLLKLQRTCEPSADLDKMQI